MADYYDALRDAVWNDDLEALQMCMHAGRIDVNHTDSAGQTLLHLASFWGRTEIVRLLVSLGASMKAKNAAGCTALDLAIHWGHSATAEMIRLRGGLSVWEEKMGLLQMQVEDLSTALADCEAENRLKDSQLSAHRAEILELHTKWRATLDLLDAETKKGVAMQARHDDLARVTDKLRADVSDLKQDLHEAQLEAIRIDMERVAAETARDASLQQREVAVRAAADACAVQVERLRNWQAAEAAAVIMETQRNAACTERDAIKLRASAMAIELRLVTERLEFTQSELATLREETLEFMEAKRKEEIRQRRAVRALEVISADDRLEKLQKAKEYGNQLKNQPSVQMAFARESSRSPTAMRVQTAAALVSQELHPDLAVFEEAFVHTVKSFTEARRDKWAALATQTNESQSQARFAVARPLFTPASSSPAGAKVNCAVYGKYAKTQRRPGTDHRSQAQRHAQLPPMLTK
ncbi:hypothetical protein SDRG_14360 [Saprolegnia diclina VS20]|uniref:Uncharacterized protein n=1 Tax=Saprolegnia diclina (strain VS20) TaxID=1156394 RepID=T0PZU8_SAPDV|nr:hypothetical protein SDRG_14360 [Saprolegnia diclina VS20]EQC27776.1 hypothetical protein SDRG_14360 [Saprolegnia diclina VS20]|eukprot:XP_008618706.1 hypothetical protein SDRG_14360 [Saprolegnia diclina VS20]